jgi:hypothetical protein
MERINRIMALVLSVICLAGCGLDENVLLSIDGVPVTNEEFSVFLNSERADSAAYFGEKYAAQVDAGFWTRSYGGEIPIEYAKQAALLKLKYAKAEEALAVERGLTKRTAFSELLAELESTNSEREEKLGSGEVFYGLTSYDLDLYYEYRRAQTWQMLLDSQAEKAAPEKELREMYEKNAEMYFLGYEVEADILYENGSVEQISLSPAGIPKEDGDRQNMYQLLISLDEGGSISAYWHNAEVTAVLRS